MAGVMTSKVADNIVVYTSMVADLFHIGHLRLLERAKSLGTSLIVGVITDECVVNYKGRRPVFSQEERLAIVSSISYVDHAVLQYERDGTQSASQFNQIDYIVRGNDVILPKERDFIESKGGKYVLLPRTSGISTTSIIKKILTS